MIKSPDTIGKSPETTENIAPEGSLAKVRETFGTLLVDSIAGSVFHKEYRGNGDRILINTTAEGIRGPKTGRTHDGGREGAAFIDFALTPEVAQRLYEQLGRAIKDWKSSQQEE
jgi:hypothetical protein